MDPSQSVPPHSTPTTLSARIIHGMGVTGVTLLLIGASISKAAQNIGMALMMLAVLMGFWPHRKRYWHNLKDDWLARLTGAWILYLIILAIITARVIPETAELQYDFAWKLSRLFLIILTAWWIAAFLRAQTAYLLVFAGYAAGAIIFHDALDWPLFYQSNRLDFWENPQFYGLLSGAALIGLLVLGRDLMAIAGQRFRYTSASLLILALGLSLNAFLISEARGAMLGLAASTLIAGALCFYRAYHHRHLAKRHLGIAVLGITLVAGILFLVVDRAGERFSRDIVAVQQALDDSAEITPSNMGIRFHQWQTAAPLWLERPVMGWGPGAGEYLHELADLPETYRSGGDHFHNTLLDLLLWTGIVGTLLFLALLGAWAKPLWRVFMAGGADGRTVLFGYMVAIMFLTASLTQTFITSQVSWFFIAAFLGPAYSFKFRARLQAPQS